MSVDADASLSTNGVIRHFSRQAFATLAADVDRCFVCGISRNIRTFNEEHVIPDWVLSRFDLHSKRVTLPNQGQVMYGKYKLRCCIDCNSLLGKIVENPVSKLFTGSFEEVNAALTTSPLLLYQWACLLYIKFHLKDREYRVDRNLQNPSEQIGDWHDWESMHHIHSVARSPQSAAVIDEAVIGTQFVVPMRPAAEPFDWGSLSDTSTLWVRLGPVGVVSVLNDAGSLAGLAADLQSKITAPLSAIQLREVAAQFAYANSLLLRRPTFVSELHPDDSLYIRTTGAVSGPFADPNDEELGALLVHTCGPLLRNSRTPNVEEILDRLSRGETGFLFRPDGSFIAD